MANPRLTPSQWSFKRKRRLVKAGLCLVCGVTPSMPDKKRCKKCILQDRLRKRPGGVWQKGKRGRPPEIF